MLISAKTTQRTSIFFSSKEAQLLIRQLQKLSARNIAALKCESRKTKCWVPWNPPPLMQLSVNVSNECFNFNLKEKPGTLTTSFLTCISRHLKKKKKNLFQKFQLISFYAYKSWIIMCIGIAPSAQSFLVKKCK